MAHPGSSSGGIAWNTTASAASTAVLAANQRVKRGSTSPPSVRDGPSPASAGRSTSPSSASATTVAIPTSAGTQGRPSSDRSSSPRSQATALTA